MQQGDVKLFQTINDGEISINDGLVEMDGGLGTAAYLCMFGGNHDDDGSDNSELQWWGNNDEDDNNFKYRSETQFLLSSLPTTTGNLRRIEDAALRDLSMFISKKIASEVTVFASIPGVDKINLKIAINADGKLSEFEFTENWEPVTIPIEPSVLTNSRILNLDDYVYKVRIEAENASRHLITAFGNAQLDGNGSLTLDGASWIGIPQSNDMLFDTDIDYTFSNWVKFTSTTGVQTIYSSSSDNPTQYQDAYLSAGSLFMRASTLHLAAAWAPTLGVWYHLEFNRNGSTGRIFIDGIQLVSGSLNSTAGTTDGLIFGRMRTDTVNYLSGQMAQIEVSRGVARHTTSFTPPNRTSLIIPDSFTVLASNLLGSVASTRIIDSAKPISSTLVSDDFTSSINSVRWTDRTISGSGLAPVISAGKIIFETTTSQGNSQILNQIVNHPDDFEISINDLVLDIEPAAPAPNGYWSLMRIKIGSQLFYVGFTNQIGGAIGTHKGHYYQYPAGGSSNLATVPAVEYKLVRIGNTITAFADSVQIGSGQTASGALVEISLYLANSSSGAAKSSIGSIVALNGSSEPILMKFNTDFLVDISGNENDTTPTNVAYIESGQGGLPSLIFDGLTSFATKASYILTQPFAMIIVAKVTANAADKPLVGDSNAQLLLTDLEYLEANAGTPVAGAIDHSGIYKVFAVTVNGANSSTLINGIPELESVDIGLGDLASFNAAKIGGLFTAMDVSAILIPNDHTEAAAISKAAMKKYSIS